MYRKLNTADRELVLGIISLAEHDFARATLLLASRIIFVSF